MASTRCHPELIGALSRGDRARLALAARASAQGDAVLLVVRCPAAGCGALADLALSTTDLAGRPRPPRSRSRSPWRRPTATARSGRRAATTNGPPAGRTTGCGAGWSAVAANRSARRAGAPSTRRVVQAIAIALAGLDPAADLAIVSACPQCGAWIEVELDPVELLVQSLATGEQRLLAEVHSLAFHYGWSEADILALPRPRRFAYLGLLRDQVEGRPLTGAGA